MDWDDAVEIDEVPPPPEQHAHGRGRGRGKGRGKGRSTGGASAGTATGVRDKCFAASCRSKKKHNGKFCIQHHKGAENCKNQAQKDGEIETYNQIFNDPVKADQALEQYEKDNCEGRFRKRLIDWGQWKRQFGVRVSTKVRNVEEWLDVAEYVDIKTKHMPEGEAKEEAKKVKTEEFKQMCNQPGIEKEGEWPSTRIWVYMKRYIDSNFEEGSKQMKDLTKVKKEDGEDGPPSKKLKHVDVATAMPKVRTKLEKKVDKARQAGDILKQMRKKGRSEQLVLATPTKPEVKPEEEGSQQPEEAVAEGRPTAEVSKEVKTEKMQGAPAVETKEEAGKDVPAQSPPLSKGIGSASSHKSSLSANLGDKQAEALKKFLGEKGIAGQVTHDNSKLASYNEMLKLVEKVSSAVTATELSSLEESVSEKCEYFNQMLTSLRQSSGALSGHIKNQEGKAEREQKKKQVEEAAEAIKKSREETKRLQEKLKASSKLAPPLFKLKFDELISRGLIRTAPAGKELNDNAIMAPLLITGPSEWKTASEVETLAFQLGKFGGSCKSSPECKQQGRAQQPLNTGEGKEVVDQFMEKMCKSVDAKLVINPSTDGAETFKTVLESTWMFGYKIPMYNLSQTSNGLGMIKTVAYGSVNMLMFDAHQVVPALRQVLSKDSVTLPEVIKHLESSSTETLSALKDRGVMIMSANVNAGDAIYIPSGWLVAESVDIGAMVYGVRKTVLFKGAGSDSYDELLGLNPGKKHPKQEAVAEFLKP
ncbi:unnamed protein product, partial [Prorocentrum cordatum]